MASLVLLVVALAVERSALQGSLTSRRSDRLGDRPAIRGRLADRDVLLVQAGIGRERAREAVMTASRECDVRAVWSLGFAGGLNERLRPGDLVFPATILDDADLAGPLSVDAPSHAAASAALRGAGLPVEGGALITVTKALCTPDAKRAAGRQSGAVAAEMEAAAVAGAARDLGIPWATLKAILDGVGDPLPPFLTGCTTAEGDLRWLGLWSAAQEGRTFWRAARRLGRASRQAGRNLRRGLHVAFRTWAALTPP